MKIVIDRQALLACLTHVQSVVERRNTIPILANVLIEAKKGGLTMTATDMDLSVTEQVAAEVGGAGATTVPAHTLYDIVRKLPEGAEIELSSANDGNQLALRAGRSKFSLSCLPSGDFPAIGGGAMPHRFSLAAGDLRNLIDRTRFAISTEETRYYLNGIYLHTAKSEGVAVLRAAATDGHRLARVEIPLPEGAAKLPGVIVPRKAVNEVRKLLDEFDGAVTVEMSDNKIRFSLSDAQLTSKLIDGTFPDYERVIPTGNDKTLQVDRRQFTAAVDRVSTISTEKSRAVKLSIDNGTVTISASSPEAGNASEEIEATYEGPKLEIGFNARYLLDITEQLDGEGARFVMADAGSPTIVRDVADGSALYVLMPLRV